MSEKITCFLPCRAGSERVVRKNVRGFAGHEFGLIEIKISQLLASQRIDEVVLTTNDLEILDFASSLSEPRLRLHKRCDGLSSSSTSTDQLVRHALDLIEEGHVVWTHVTSPFLTADHYDEIVSVYHEQVRAGYDSLMTTTTIRGFLWQNEKPMNYDRTIEKWPRTQTLEPVYEVNSGAFLAPIHVYEQLDDRIGCNPYLYETGKFASFDIDWPEDFLIAECLLEKGLAKI